MNEETLERLKIGRRKRRYKEKMRILLDDFESLGFDDAVAYIEKVLHAGNNQHARMWDNAGPTGVREDGKVSVFIPRLLITLVQPFIKVHRKDLNEEFCALMEELWHDMEPNTGSSTIFRAVPCTALIVRKIPMSFWNGLRQCGAYTCGVGSCAFNAGAEERLFGSRIRWAVATWRKWRQSWRKEKHEDRGTHDG